ncbi:MAG: alpha/beta fold hydrolase [Gammaproteobacteria bacterium]|nr:alpha/beta fold hydrolase [Gammaproteobacteria bacterium]
MPELYFQDYPGPAGPPPLVLLHGLFGSGTNWRGIARRLSGQRRVLVMDLRNHGRSFNDGEMTYPLMAGDIFDTLDAEGLDRVDLVGHSMGGKAAMVAALEKPDRVARLVVVDIAPVPYTHSHAPLIDALLSLDVDGLKSRGEAEEALSDRIEDRMLRQFLLQSLEKSEAGYRWRLNLEALKQGMEYLVGFPDMEGRVFDGPTLFLHGANSDYVQSGQRPLIEGCFPRTRYAAVGNAGHWVHAEQPESVIEHIADFLAR